MVGDPSYALGMLRWSSVGLTVVIVGTGGGGGWKGKEEKRFPIWVTGWVKAEWVCEVGQWLLRTDWISPQ